MVQSDGCPAGMTQIFAEPSQLVQTPDGRTLIRVEGEEYHHLTRVLRLKPGEEFSVRLKDDGSEYRFGVIEIQDTVLMGELRFIKKEASELPAKIWLFQGLPKADKMELIVQKSVELGAAVIVPVAMKRSIVRLDAKKAESKRARWAGIAASAAGQSRRGIQPEVLTPVSFREALALMDREGIGTRLLPYELADASWAETRQIFDGLGEETVAQSERQIAVWIGPEGGFDTEEIRLAREAGCACFTMGPRILRTETAGFTILAWLNYVLQGL